jgi:hypothetical protein
MCPGHKTSTPYNFILGWDRCGFHKNSTGTRNAKHVFLHPARSGVHVMHSCASGVRKVDKLFFMLGWERYGFDKKHAGHVMLNLFFFFLHMVGSVCHVVHFGASGHESLTHYFSSSSGTETDLTKSTQGHVMSNMSFFASGGIYVSRSAFWCIRILK